MPSEHPSSSSRPVTEHLPLSEPVYQILLSLAGRPLHGYGVIQDIRRRTDGLVDLTASTLYGALKRLRKDALVDEVDAPAGEEGADPRRRYYTLTARGRDLLRAEALRLRKAVEAAVRKGLVPPAGSGP